MNVYNSKMADEEGMSFIEILVVIGIFAMLGIITSRAISVSLSGSKKTESLIKVRENINFSLGVIARQLRNANSITTCTNAATNTITYIDQYNNATNFSCDTTSGAGFIASGSAHLTSDSINVTSCSFTCEPGVSGNPDIIKIDISANDKNLSGSSDSVVTSSTSVSLRNY